MEAAPSSPSRDGETEDDGADRVERSLGSSKQYGHEKAAIGGLYLSRRDFNRRGADRENDEGAAFCCAESSAPG